MYHDNNFILININEIKDNNTNHPFVAMKDNYTY